MCILCNAKYDLFSMMKDGLHGLAIENCDKIQEITLPPLRSLEVENCANLHTIHCEVSEHIILDDLPELTTLDVTESKPETNGKPFVRRINACNCPKFLLAANCCEFEELVYEIDGIKAVLTRGKKSA